MNLADRSKSALVLILGCAAISILTPSCGDSDTNTPGAGGATAGSGGKATGGAGGKAGAATGGATGKAGAGTGGAVADGGAPAGGAPEGGAAPAGGAGGASAGAGGKAAGGAGGATAGAGGKANGGAGGATAGAGGSTAGAGGAGGAAAGAGGAVTAGAGGAAAGAGGAVTAGAGGAPTAGAGGAAAGAGGAAAGAGGATAGAGGSGGAGNTFTSWADFTISVENFHQTSPDPGSVPPPALLSVISFDANADSALSASSGSLKAEVPFAASSAEVNIGNYLGSDLTTLVGKTVTAYVRLDSGAANVKLILTGSSGYFPGTDLVLVPGVWTKLTCLLPAGATSINTVAVGIRTDGVTCTAGCPATLHIDTIGYQ